MVASWQRGVSISISHQLLHRIPKQPQWHPPQAEVERLLFEDPDPDTGFMLHPDLKWDQVPKPACLALL